MFKRLENKLNQLDTRYIDNDKFAHFNDTEKNILLTCFFVLTLILSVIFYFSGNLFLILLQVLFDLYVIFSFYVIVKDLYKEYEHVSTLPVFFIALFVSIICLRVFPYRGNDIKLKRKEKLKKLKRYL